MIGSERAQYCNEKSENLKTEGGLLGVYDFHLLLRLLSHSSPGRTLGTTFQNDFSLYTNGLDDLWAGCNVGYIPLSEP